MTRKSIQQTLKLWAQLSFVCLLLMFSLAATDDAARFDSIGHKLMCTCGCGQVLLECNHLGCTYLAEESTMLRTAIANGDTEAVILDAFEAKYGPTVFSSPIRGGFDRVAWIVPPVVLLLACLLAAFVIRRWRHRAVPATANAAPSTVDSDAMRERIRKDTEDFL